MAEGLFERNGILKECLGKTLLGTSWWGGGFSHDGNLRPHRGPDALWEEVDVAVLDAGACQDGCPPQLLLGLQLCRYCRGFLCRSKAKSKEIDPPPEGSKGEFRIGNDVTSQTPEPGCCCDGTHFL